MKGSSIQGANSSTDRRISEAMSAVHRKDFLPETMQNMAQVDSALPIGYDQTISQLSTVKFMLEILAPEEGHNVLDIGSGSGWQSALLAHMVGEKGHVYAVEVLKALCLRARGSLQKYRNLAKRVTIQCINAKEGLPEVAMKIGGFDRIVVAASVNVASEAWRRQLRTGGRLVYPRKDELVLEQKLITGEMKETVFPGFVFVPFVE